jgi:HEAT repeat protein
LHGSTADEEEIIYALGRIGDPRAIRPLVECWGRNKPSYALVADALAEIGKEWSAQVCETCNRLLGGDDGELAFWAAFVLLKIGAQIETDTHMKIVIHSIISAVAQTPDLPAFRLGIEPKWRSSLEYVGSALGKDVTPELIKGDFHLDKAAIHWQNCSVI